MIQDAGEGLTDMVCHRDCYLYTVEMMEQMRQRAHIIQ